MHQPFRHISVSSPGKVVIAGEYAVLYGASALSLAIDRRARCTLTTHDEGVWRLRSSPPFWNETVSLEALLSKSRTDSLSSTLNWFARQKALPDHVSVHMDTLGFFLDQRKLGLGSSAAVLVTLYAALATLLELPIEVKDLLSVYRSSGVYGSGVDVLTSFFGGLVQVQDQIGTSVDFPKGIYLDIYEVGFSTETATMVDRFRTAFDNVPVTLQQSFINAADTVSNSLTDNNNFLNALQNFVQIYRDIDTNAKLAIWSAKHEEMYRLAADVGALYKPAGAGGGDIGVAVATEQESLAALRLKAVELPVNLLDLQQDTHGVRIEKSA